MGAMNITTPLLELVSVSRSFCTGDQPIFALRDVNLTINRGEFIAIVGTSGSGKSTLMNILGCLDRPTGGGYTIDGLDTNALDREALAQLRREYFGFIFQRYHLLPLLSAEDNVVMPAIYAGTDRIQRHQRARMLLTRLGLRDRIAHKPSQLSGGQQQRVSIARALMNGGAVILADEPTGALDSVSGQEVMDVLLELNASGHTIIIATHDFQVAAYADRIIRLHDGVVVEDSCSKQAQRCVHEDPIQSITRKRSSAHVVLAPILEAFRMAIISLRSNRLRTALTMLGIVIGITSVVSIVALSKGAEHKLAEQLLAFGTNTVEIIPGRDWGDTQASTITTLREPDVTALRQLHYVMGVSPIIRSSGVVRYGNSQANVLVHGVNDSFLKVRGMLVERGIFFRETDILSQAQVVVIDRNTQKKVFGLNDAIGQIVLVHGLPCRVIGVLQEHASSILQGNTQLSVWLPFTTVGVRMLGRQHFDEIMVRIRDGQPSTLAQANLLAVITRQHGTQDCFTANAEAIASAQTQVVQTISMLLSFIACIALGVGGIGVMNIMLVSVTERAREIGIRSAVGARYQDLLAQFLIEAIAVCVMGGVFGLFLSYLIGVLVTLAIPQWLFILSPSALLVAFLTASITGVVFGYLPARKAARLDPIVSLARE